MQRTSINLTKLRHGHSCDAPFIDRFNAYQADGYVLQIKYTITSVESTKLWRKFLCVTDDGQQFSIVYRMFPDGSMQGVGYINQLNNHTRP